MQMPEFTVHADSPPHTGDESVAVRVHEALEADPRALGPSVALDLRELRIGATFTGIADSIDEAAAVGAAAFADALRASGVDAGADRLELETAG